MEEKLTKLSIKELIAKAVDSELASEDQKQVKDLLESMYTSMIYKCIDNALTRDPNSLIFQDEEKLKIDMGIISDEAYISDESRNTIQKAWNNRTPSYRLKLLYFSNWLEEFYLNNLDFGINNLKQLESEIDETDRRVFQNQLELSNLQQNSDQLYEQLSDMSDMGPSLRKKVKEYILSLSRDQLEERLLYNILELKWKQEHEGFTDKEEMMNLSKCVLELSKTKSIRNDILKEIKKPYNKPLIAKQLQEYYDNIESIKTEQFTFEKQLTSLNDEKEKFKEKLHSFSLFKRAEIMKNEIMRLQLLLRTCGIRGKIMNPFIIHISKHLSRTQDVLDIIDQINENDPTLFSNPYSYRVGLPRILFVTVQGNGFYDIKSNCLFFPIFSHNLMDSVVDMLTDYRLEVDEKKELMKSFTNEIPIHKKLTNYSKFKELFKRYYMIWITRGVQGYTVLNKDERQWFKEYISPPNDQIIIPYELLAFQPKDLTNAEERTEAELKTNPDSALLHLKLGAIKVLLEKQTDKILDCFFQALKLDSKLHDAEYNIAQIYMKIEKKQEAKEYFLKYSSHNYQNWWTIIAREWLKR